MGYTIRRVRGSDGLIREYLVEQSERTVRPLTDIEASGIRSLPRDMFLRWAREVDATVPSTLESGANTIRRVRQ